jgi:tetratricopeptide (TPR) repeat protein
MKDLTQDGGTRMKRLGGVLFALTLFVPMAAQAQTRPSNTMQTRSAELYVDRARRTTAEADKKKLLEQALGFALEGIKTRADNPKAYFLAGQIYVELGDAVAVDSMFDKAVQLWPEYAAETDKARFQIWARAYNAGVTALRANNREEAAKQFASATAVYDKRAGAHLNLAQIYAHQNQPDKAIATYREALAILAKPENRQGIKPEEEAQMKELEEAATFNLAQMLATSGKNDEAVTAYQDFLKRNPTNTLARSNLAVVLSKMGKNEEAAKIYSELLEQDLSAEDFFGIGVGLFRATQHAPAAQAFRKAVAKNAYMRDAYYNLAQALYSLGTELDEQKSKATGEAAKPMVAKLIELHTELTQVTDKLRGLDPANRNVFALQSRAYRALADLTTDAKASAEWKNKILEVLKANDALVFTVEDITATTANGEMQIAGSAVNVKGTAGQSVKLRVHFLGTTGNSVGTQDVTIALGEVQKPVAFKTSFKADGVVGWKYEVLGG